MKKVLKSFRCMLLSEEEASKPTEKPKGKPNSKSGGQNTTATRALTNPKHGQDDQKSVKEGTQPSTQTHPGNPQEMRKPNSSRLFMGGLPDDVTEADLTKFFEKYGEVRNVMIAFDRETNKRKRYGFLEFRNEDSANKCLDDHFVIVKGRRVEIKKALPRGFAKKGEENGTKKERKENSVCEKLPSGPRDLENMVDFSLGSSCTGGESDMEDGQFIYQKLFEDYFKAKFALQSVLGSGKVSDNSVSEENNEQQRRNEIELEKMLTGLCVFTKEGSSAGGDDMDFSSDFDETYSSAEDLNTDSTETDVTTQTDHEEKTFQMNDELVCALCKWAPLDNSIEGFLAHCETLAHKQRLKERFKNEEVPKYVHNKTFTQTVNPTITNKTNKQCKRRRNRLMEPPSGCQNKQRNRKKKKSILQEIMTSVEAEADKFIKCKMCNKTIPPAQDFQVLMANLSHHLQSKGHVARIRDFEKKREMEVDNLKKGGATVSVGKTQKQSKNAKDYKILVVK